MQQIQIEIVGAETVEAPVDRLLEPAQFNLIGLHFQGEKYTVALTGNHPTDESLGGAVSIISRRIDHRHAKRDACAHRLFLDRLSTPSLTEMPAALTERRDGRAIWKRYGARCRLRVRAGVRNLCTCLVCDQ